MVCMSSLWRQLTLVAMCCFVTRHDMSVVIAGWRSVKVFAYKMLRTSAHYAEPSSSLHTVVYFDANHTWSLRWLWSVFELLYCSAVCKLSGTAISMPGNTCLEASPNRRWIKIGRTSKPYKNVRWHAVKHDSEVSRNCHLLLWGHQVQKTCAHSIKSW